MYIAAVNKYASLCALFLHPIGNLVKIIELKNVSQKIQGVSKKRVT